MPIKDAAKKYMRVTASKTARNAVTRGLFRGAVKKVRTAIGAKNVEDATKWFVSAQQYLDKAAKKGVIKSNTAARVKSRLNASIKALKG